MVTALASRRRSPKPVLRTNRDRPIRVRVFVRMVNFGSQRTIDARSHASCAASSTARVVPLRDALDAELRLQEIIHSLRIGLAAGLLHHLADEPAGELRLGFRLRDLVRIGRSAQMPSFSFSMSLTSFGFAFPPNRFIPLPTNPPNICLLPLACSTLSGFCKHSTSICICT